MATIAPTTASVNTATFDQALRAAANRALACYPQEACRLRRGLTIAQHGDVEILMDGLYAVRSQSAPDTFYKVNGHCDCRDQAKAPGGRCKHRWAKALYKAALADQKRHCGPDRFWASYYAPDGEVHPGIAEWYAPKQCWLFIPEDGMDPLFPAMQALCLGGHIATEQAQRAEDGDLHTKFAMPQYHSVDLEAAKAALAAIRAKRLAHTWGA